MCFYVPSAKDGLEVGRKLELHGINVGSTVPLWFAFGIETCKAKTSEDTGTLVNWLNKLLYSREKKCIPRWVSRERKISLFQMFLQAGISKS